MNSGLKFKIITIGLRADVRLGAVAVVRTHFG